MKGKKIAVVIVILIVAGCLGAGLYQLENYDEFYYAKIDNSKIQELPSGEDMKYEYTLDGYNKKGNKRELKFKTSRELREGAYILLEVKIAGVHKWEEMKYDDLPQKVKEKID